MSMPRFFKRIFAVASGATATAVAVVYTEQLYKMNSRIDESDAVDIEKINKGFADLQKAENCTSLLKKNLTPSLLGKLEHRKTKLGATLYDIMRSGLHNLDSVIGVYAADTESYKKFAPLFDKIIEDYHGFKVGDKQPATDLGEDKLNEFPPLDPGGNYIRSVRIHCARSVAGYPFSSLLSSDDYVILEQKIKNALSHIDDVELKGVYYPLIGMSRSAQDEFCINHSVFNNNDRFLQYANAYNFWPIGRGVFHNRNKTFMIWVNEEDHLGIISMQEGSDVGKALSRLIRGLKSLESKLNFAYDDRLGWLTACPSNLGSAVHASVQIRLPVLSKRKNFMEICDNLGLLVRPVAGQQLGGGVGGYYFISNKVSLGLTQYEAVKQMYDGVKELIRLEEASK